MGNKNDRRTFLKGIGFGSVLLSTMQYSLSANEENQKVDKSPHYGMVFDQNKCVGCTDCENACAEINLVPKGQKRLFVQDKTDQNHTDEKRYVRVSCQQCEEAPCVQACPTNASHRDSITNIVTMNADDCIGCKYCIVACPYDVRFINEETKAAENCNFCLNSNFKEGKKPACVEACKYTALVFGDLNDETSYINKLLRVKDSVRMKPGFGTKPSLRYIPIVKLGV
ncbi:4Fe-4S dicluster domain-containing protein [Sulfurospirillum arcachonense]|uniref:4Fe-4S dicluster domain-containing protein n=1 Tax=Sulfurospirillum arcachonense TaxID=57666 RepID=UPI0004688902|nr:4Fe-4S dicluster domain-containing protein [Sulfurospirillum arcachonense]